MWEFWHAFLPRFFLLSHWQELTKLSLCKPNQFIIINICFECLFTVKSSIQRQWSCLFRLTVKCFDSKLNKTVIIFILLFLLAFECINNTCYFVDSLMMRAWLKWMFQPTHWMIWTKFWLGELWRPAKSSAKQQIMITLLGVSQVHNTFSFSTSDYLYIIRLLLQIYHKKHDCLLWLSYYTNMYIS